MAAELLYEVDKLYETANIEAKRYLVGLLFPEKLVYDMEGYVEFRSQSSRKTIIYHQIKKGKSAILRLFSPSMGGRTF